MENKKINSIDIKKIGATLKHGRFLALNVYVGSVGIIFSFVVAAICIFLLRGTIPQNVWIWDLVTISLWALFFTWSIITIRRTLKIKKEVLLWLEDAIELDAYAEQLEYLGYFGLQVTFVYNQEKLKRESKCKRFMAIEGHDAFWEDYKKKNFKIYYSPKYDEVMLFAAKVNTNVSMDTLRKETKNKEDEESISD